MQDSINAANADIGYINGGGLRTDILAGDITFYVLLEQGALLQEYFVYFKKAQRIYDTKLSQSAANAIVRCCLK